MKVNELKLSRISTKEKLGEVQVMSIHKAKGLEWPVVVVANAEENQFPYIAKGDNKIPCNIQEERRLFFVAATRAINSCYVLSQSEKMGSDTKIKGSIFLDESQINVAKKVAAILSSGDKSGLNSSQKEVFDEYKDKLLKVA
jgi:DNA helicase-2/ATP-dependent DNA helicase PcrA